MNRRVSLAWKQVVGLVALSALVASLAAASAVLLLTDGRNDQRGAVVTFGRGGFEDLPFCVEHNRFCLIESESDGWLALYTYDTHQPSRERGCLIDWRPDFAFVDPETGEDTTGWFRARCSGSTYDAQGHHVFGPAARDMDQFPVVVTNDRIEVDTRQLLCGETLRPIGGEECRRAPYPE